MRCTVRELGQRLDSRELTEWIAYDKIDPIGDERQDILFGCLMSLIANINRAKTEPLRDPGYFLPKWEELAFKESPEPQTEDEMIERIRAINRALGGTELPRGDDRKTSG